MSAKAGMAPTGFNRFELNDDIVRGIHAAGFERARNIQQQTIPAGLEGRDVLGLAQTGTGKTAAFVIPILQRLIGRRGKSPRALILAPTRELANQIAEQINTLAKFTGLNTATIFGGIPIHKQRKFLKRRPDIIVGCPGRVLDVVGQGFLNLSQVETLVLDEADHMFDMGFLKDIRKILDVLPKKRQNLLFSATMPKEIRRLADQVLYKPHVVELANSSPAETIDHGVYLIPEKSKRDLLDHIFNSEECNSAIVFTRTKRRARKLAKDLKETGYRAADLQGNMSQAQRDRAMRGFKERKFEVLVATDIAARGIDVSKVSHVINYDVPTTSEAYTHRIGRTGRSEEKGIACTFVTGKDMNWLRSTERMLKKKIDRIEVEGFEPDPHQEPAKKKAKTPKKQKGCEMAWEQRSG